MFYKNFFIDKLAGKHVVFCPTGTYQDCFNFEHEAKSFVDDWLIKEFGV